jgi:peptidoglycan hydrolase-like protein with peptidoglycan-binding domain
VIKPDLVVKPPQDPKPPVLSKGAKGLWVQKLQERLKLRGYTLAVDSVFGPRTLHIVKLFQRSNKLVVDGIVGPHTWTALLKPVKPKPKPKPKKRSTPKVRRSVPKGRRKRGKTNDVAPSA